MAIYSDSFFASRFFKMKVYPQLTGLPRHKFLFAVKFHRPNGSTSLSRYNDWGEGIMFLVKNVERPKFQIDQETVNQYNKKRIIQRKIEYPPINIRFHDTNDDRVTDMVYEYVQFYYGDFIKLQQNDWLYDTTSKQFHYGPNNKGWGFVPPRNMDPPNSYFFSKIEIYQFGIGNYSKFELINPKIVSVENDTLDYSENNPPEINIQFSFEGVLWSVRNKSVTPEIGGLFLDVSGNSNVNMDFGLGPPMPINRQMASEIARNTALGMGSSGSSGFGGLLGSGGGFSSLFSGSGATGLFGGIGGVVGNTINFLGQNQINNLASRLGPLGSFISPALGSLAAGPLNLIGNLANQAVSSVSSLGGMLDLNFGGFQIPLGDTLGFGAQVLGQSLVTNVLGGGRMSLGDIGRNVAFDMASVLGQSLMGPATGSINNAITGIISQTIGNTGLGISDLVGNFPGGLVPGAQLLQNMNFYSGGTTQYGYNGTFDPNNSQPGFLESTSRWLGITETPVFGGGMAGDEYGSIGIDNGYKIALQPEVMDSSNLQYGGSPTYDYGYGEAGDNAPLEYRDPVAEMQQSQDQQVAPVPYAPASSKYEGEIRAYSGIITDATKQIAQTEPQFAKDISTGVQTLSDAYSSGRITEEEYVSKLSSLERKVSDYAITYSSDPRYQTGSSSQESIAPPPPASQREIPIPSESTIQTYVGLEKMPANYTALVTRQVDAVNKQFQNGEIPRELYDMKIKAIDNQVQKDLRAKGFLK